MLVYDYIITISLEVALIRSQRWTVSVLFFLNRYLALFNMVIALLPSTSVRSFFNSSDVRLMYSRTQQKYVVYYFPVCSCSVIDRVFSVVLALQLNASRQCCQ